MVRKIKAHLSSVSTRDTFNAHHLYGMSSAIRLLTVKPWNEPKSSNAHVEVFADTHQVNTTVVLGFCFDRKGKLDEAEEVYFATFNGPCGQIPECELRAFAASAYTYDIDFTCGEGTITCVKRAILTSGIDPCVVQHLDVLGELPRNLVFSFDVVDGVRKSVKFKTVEESIEHNTSCWGAVTRHDRGKNKFMLTVRGTGAEEPISEWEGNRE